MQSFFTLFNLISLAEDEKSVLEKELHDYKVGTKKLLEKMRELQGKLFNNWQSFKYPWQNDIQSAFSVLIFSTTNRS